MALAYLLCPTFQIENTAGKPATGGYLEVYIAGSRNKYYCASDFNGTLHPFRIELDSLGSNVVLADDSNAYDVYVYNRYGSLMMSRYGVKPGAGGGISSATITSTDGSIIVTPTENGVDLRVDSEPPTSMRCSASDLQESDTFEFVEVQRDGTNASVNNNGQVVVNSGWWHYDVVARLKWPANPAENITSSVVLYAPNGSSSSYFDRSYGHDETLQLSGEYKCTQDGTVFPVGIQDVPSGMTVELVDFGIHSVTGEGAGGVYTAGDGITIDEPNRVISVDFSEVQEKLTAGEGISIDENNVISVDGVENGFVTMSPVVAPPDGSGLFIQAGYGLRERVLDYKYYELPALQSAGSENASTYIVAAPWKFRTQFEINTNTHDSNMRAVGFFLSANVPGGSSGLANCVVEWSVDKNHTAYLRSKTLVVPTYESEGRYVPYNSQNLKQGGYFFSFEVPSSAFVEKMLEDDRFEMGGDWSGYSGARGYMFFSLYNTVTHQYMSLPKTDGEKMAVEKIYSLQVDTTKVQPRLTAGNNITIVDNVISAATADNLFIAVYGVTPIGEVDTAYAQGKDILCRYNSHGHVYSSQLSSLVSGIYTFTTTDGFSDYEFTLSPDGGTGAWSIGSMAIPSGAQLVPAATTSDAGEVLTVDQNGVPEWAPAQAPISAGDGIDITNNVISVDTSVVATQNDLAGKQDVISDLSSIRAGAALGATAVQDPNYVHTDNNYTDADKTKLAGIQAGAEANVQSDWAESDSSSDSFIRNKPDQTNLVAGSNITIVDDAQNNTVTISAAATQAPVQDVTVGGVSVLNAQGVAEIPSIPVIGTITL